MTTPRQPEPPVQPVLPEAAPRDDRFSDWTPETIKILPPEEETP